MDVHFQSEKSNEKSTRRSREGQFTQGKWVSFATDESQLTLVRKATSIQEKTAIRNLSAKEYKIHMEFTEH